MTLERRLCRTCKHCIPEKSYNKFNWFGLVKDPTTWLSHVYAHCAFHKVFCASALVFFREHICEDHEALR